MLNTTVMLIAAYKYRIPLVQPLKLAHGELSEREGLLLKLQHQDEITWGEAAPLPGFSKESLKEVEQALKGWLQQELGFEQLPPSLQFAIDMGQNPLAQAESVQTAQLMTSNIGCALAQQNLPEKTVIKVKVGQHSVTDDIERIKQLKQAFPKALWRLDANRLWNLEQALAFAKGVGTADSIAFIEEPCATLSETQALALQSGWPLALDETLQQKSFVPELFPGLAALVCKPTLIGGLDRCQRLADFASQHNLEFIVSGSFESNLGHDHLNSLASLWDAQGVHGLDTLSKVGADLLTSRAQSSSLPVISEHEMELVWSQ